MSEIELEGRVALVTGSGRGLGAEIAEELARAGMMIAGLDVREDELSAALAGIGERHGVKTLPVLGDVSQERDVVEAVGRTIEGLGPIYALVNNAGIRQVSPIWETDTDLWDRIIGINLRGEFLCTREVLRQCMRDRDEGRIVFISSIAGRRGARRSAAYAASKWGILGLASSVAQDLKDTSIGVTALTPGRTETPMARESEQWDPDIGWLDAASVARAVVFCLRQDAATVIPEIHMHHRAEL